MKYNATWYALDDSDPPVPLPPLEYSGTGPLILSFKLASTFALGSSTPVNFTLNWSDQNLDPFGPNTAVANVTAVPVPPSCMLLFSGIGALAGWASRRRSIHPKNGRTECSNSQFEPETR